MATLADISEHLHIKEGFCHPDWASISEIIETSLPESEWNSAWEAASRMWVERIREKLGEDYQIFETAKFIILSEAPLRIIKDTCKTCEDSLKRILANLEGAASDEGYGKHVVLMFANLDDYYGYITYFYPDGENPMSSGVCLGGDGMFTSPFRLSITPHIEPFWFTN